MQSNTCGNVSVCESDTKHYCPLTLQVIQLVQINAILVVILDSSIRGKSKNANVKTKRIHYIHQIKL